MIYKTLAFTSAVLLGACSLADKQQPQMGASLFGAETLEDQAQSDRLAYARKVAHAYHFGISVPKDHIIAREKYEGILAEFSDTRTMNDYALLLLEDDTRVEDHKKAVTLLKKASSLNNASARFNLGLMTYEGSYGVPHNPSKGLDMISVAANQGHEKAMAFMARYTDHQSGGAQEYNSVLREKFLAWAAKGDLPKWRQSAINSNYNRLWDTYFALDLEDRSKMKSDILALESGCLECGSSDDDIVARKLSEMEIWREKASDGDRVSQFNMGLAYLRGDGVPIDREEGVRMLHRSAEAGYAPAQYNLGLAFLNGNGIAKDLSQAYAWFDIAAADDWGYAEADWAAKMRDWSKDFMPKEAVEQGQRWATSWSEKAVK